MVAIEGGLYEFTLWCGMQCEAFRNATLWVYLNCLDTSLSPSSIQPSAQLLI